MKQSHWRISAVLRLHKAQFIMVINNAVVAWNLPNKVLFYGTNHFCYISFPQSCGNATLGEVSWCKSEWTKKVLRCHEGSTRYWLYHCCWYMATFDTSLAASSPSQVLPITLPVFLPSALCHHPLVKGEPSVCLWTTAVSGNGSKMVTINMLCMLPGCSLQQWKAFLLT